MSVDVFSYIYIGSRASRLWISGIDGEALLESASEFGNEDRRYKEEKGGMSAFDKRTGRVSAHLPGRASSVLRSKRLKDGKRHTARGTEKDALEKGLKGRLKKGQEGSSIGRVW